MRQVKYIDDNFDVREGTVLERNGNLSLIESDSGELEWLALFEIGGDDLPPLPRAIKHPAGFTDLVF